MHLSLSYRCLKKKKKPRKCGNTQSFPQHFSWDFVVQELLLFKCESFWQQHATMFENTHLKRFNVKKFTLIPKYAVTDQDCSVQTIYLSLVRYKICWSHILQVEAKVWSLLILLLLFTMHWIQYIKLTFNTFLGSFSHLITAKLNW